MPLYQYQCRDPKCGLPFEGMNKMAKAGHPKSCVACGGIADRVYVAPHVQSDATVYTLDQTGGNQFTTPYIRDWYLQKAKERGVNVTGKKYDHQLANFPGDPRAWVGSDGDIREVCEDRGFGCAGKVKVKAKHDGPTGPGKGGLAARHVRQLVHERMTVEPGQKLSKVVEDVVNDHAPPKAKRIIPSPRRSPKRKK